MQAHPPPSKCYHTTSEFIFLSSDTSSSLQNAYASDELTGYCIIKIQFSFSFRWLRSPDPLIRGSAPWTPLGALPLDPRYRLELRARHVVPHCSEEIAATANSTLSLAYNCSDEIVSVCPPCIVWLNGLVVSALGIRARGPGFDFQVAPSFHCVATLGKLFTHIASPVFQLQETGYKNEFSAPKWLW